jgi:hypothetical protein
VQSAAAGGGKRTSATASDAIKGTAVAWPSVRKMPA